VFLHYLAKEWKPKLFFYLLDMLYVDCHQTCKTHWYYHLVTVSPLFIHWTVDCVHQTWATKGLLYSMRLSTHSFIIYQVCHTVCCRVKNVICSSLSLAWKSTVALTGYLTVQQLLAAVKHVSRLTVLCFCMKVHWHVWCCPQFTYSSAISFFLGYDPQPSIHTFIQIYVAPKS